MQDKARAPSSALRPSQASAAELVAGGCQIAIPAKQPLGELTQARVAEYALSASTAQIDSEESRTHSSSSFQRFSLQNFSSYLTPTPSFIDNKAPASFEN
jgi:hypothetical protein